MDALTKNSNEFSIKQPIIYTKKIDDITMEWIKTMPYIIRKFKLLETEKYLTTDLCEEIFSKQY